MEPWGTDWQLGADSSLLDRNKFRIQASCSGGKWEASLHCGLLEAGTGYVHSSAQKALSAVERDLRTCFKGALSVEWSS